MSEQALGALTRRVSEAISRRDSLLTLGASAVAAAVARPALTEAGKGNKKAKKIKKKKCKRQVGQCSDFLTAACQNDPVCESAITCCGLFANCDAANALPCIFTN